MLNVLSLFSGIGAFEKALDNLGVDFNLVAFCEFDKYASKSYCAIHGVDESKNLGDITKVDETKLPKNIDILTYGFPCQDISLAGKQKGLFNEDGTQTRSGLFFEALRIIEATEPKIAIAENVKNLTSKKFAEQFKIVLDSLGKAGYNNYWAVLNSKNYGVPQNRDRVLIVSIRKDIDHGLFEFPAPFPLKKRLMDLLEEVVDEKYYLSQKGFDYVFNMNTEAKGIGFSDAVDTSFINPNIANTLSVKSTGSHYQRSGTSTFVSNDIDTPLSVADMKKAIRQNGIWISEKGVRYILSPKRGMCTDINADVIQPLTAKGQSNWTGSFVSPDIERLEKGTTIGGKEPVKIKLKNGETITSDDDISHLRIRKLTPKECFRLMGFDDESFHRAEAVNSNTQLYKQAGNSIVVDVLEELFCMMLDEGGNLYV